jgi:hypothetical protein
MCVTHPRTVGNMDDAEAILTSLMAASEDPDIDGLIAALVNRPRWMARAACRGMGTVAMTEPQSCPITKIGWCESGLPGSNDPGRPVRPGRIVRHRGTSIRRSLRGHNHPGTARGTQPHRSRWQAGIRTPGVSVADIGMATTGRPRHRSECADGHAERSGVN